MGQAQFTRFIRSLTIAIGGLAAAAIMFAGISASWLSAPAGAAGILPPGNPLLNVAPSSSDFLTSINSASALEGVGPMTVSESAVSSLPIPEQVFVIVNLERIDRGLPAISYMTAQLNSDAQQGADTGSDPGFPTTLSGGSPIAWGGAIWAGGLSNVFEADYYWMYEDGWGGLLSATSNVACTTVLSPECWGHRDIILHSSISCGTAAPTLSMGAAFSPTGYQGGSMAAVMTDTCGAPPSDVTLSWSQVVAALTLPVTSVSTASSARSIGMAPLGNGQGYWEAEANGAVADFGQAQNYGSMAGQNLNSPIVGLTSTPDGRGYWLLAADGGIFSFGDAAFHGSTGSLRLNSPIVSMTSTPDGRGYWMVASDGGIFAFGDAPFLGSMGGQPLNQHIVGMAVDTVTGGYWLVASDGGIFAFGAPFFGSTGSLHLARSIVGMEALSSGQGYRFVAADGGVFCFGQAGFAGSMGGQSLAAAVVGMATDSSTGGYWLLAADGGLFNFGGAGFFGTLA